MTPRESQTRRGFLTAGLGVIAATAIAGCSEAGEGTGGDATSPGPESDGSDTTAGPTQEGTGAARQTGTLESGDGATTESGDGTSTAATADTTTEGATETTTAGADLDLREANVVGVEVSDGSGGVRFAVTLHHDDDGEAGYANWWQVETRDGERLGRRDLLHPHSTQPFTRSTTVDVPDGVDCVVVRGHDETHGDGGRAMLVHLPSGRTRAVDQGSEPDDLAGAACP